MLADKDDIQLTVLLDRYERIGRHIREGLELDLPCDLDKAFAQQAKLRKAIAEHVAGKFGEATRKEVLAQMDNIEHEVVQSVNAALTHGGVRSLGAKFERLRGDVREVLGLTGHDDEVTALTSAMDPLKCEMIDWVVRRAYRRGDRAALIRRVWDWYLGERDLAARHPIKFDTFTADVSRKFAAKQKGKYQPLTRYRYLTLPMD